MSMSKKEELQDDARRNLLDAYGITFDLMQNQGYTEEDACVVEAWKNVGKCIEEYNAVFPDAQI